MSSAIAVAAVLAGVRGETRDHVNTPQQYYHTYTVAERGTTYIWTYEILVVLVRAGTTSSWSRQYNTGKIYHRSSYQLVDLFPSY